MLLSPLCFTAWENILICVFVSFIHSFNKFLLCTYHQPDPALSARDRAINSRDKNPSLQRTNIPVEESNNTQTDKQIQVLENAKEEKKKKKAKQGAGM